MKRIILAGVLLISLAMAMSSVQGFTTYTSSQRETVKVLYAVSSQHITGTASYNTNITLPWPVGDFDHALTAIDFHFLGPVNMTSGYWNNRNYPANHHYTAGWANETMTIAISNGFDVNRTYSHINIQTNNTNWEAYVHYYLSNAADIASIVTYAEKDKATPRVGGTWAVNDTLTIGTMPTLSLSIKLKYPSTAAGTPDLFPWNGTSVGTGSVLYVNYQKYGPAHNEDALDVTGSAGAVTVTFESKDRMKDATWDIDFTDEVWDGIFATATGPVTVKVNGDTMDATDVVLGTNSLVLSGMAIDNDDNTVVFTWTVPSTTPPSTTAPDVWVQEYFTGVPNWAIGAIALIVVIAGIAIWSTEKKK